MVTKGHIPLSAEIVPCIQIGRERMYMLIHLHVPT